MGQYEQMLQVLQWYKLGFNPMPVKSGIKGSGQSIAEVGLWHQPDTLEMGLDISRRPVDKLNPWPCSVI